MPDTGRPFDAVSGNEAEALRRLLDEDPARSESRNEGGVSLLMWTLYHRRPELTGIVLAHHPGPDVHETAALDGADRLAGLLDADPDLRDARSPDGFTPLHLAAFFGGEAATRLLLERGADPDAEAHNPTRVTPLHSAVAGGSAAVVRLLLDRGAAVDARQQMGFTPLMGAAANGRLEILKLLLERGADRSIASEEGKTAREYAESRGRSDAAALL